MKKLIDFEALCEIIHLQCDPNCDGLINHCPIWNSLPDAVECFKFNCPLDGEYVKHEDHLKAIAEAKKEGVREILNKALRFECKEIDCSNCLEENDIVCAINGIVRTYGVDEVIKKLEA